MAIRKFFLQVKLIPPTVAEALVCFHCSIVHHDEPDEPGAGYHFLLTILSSFISHCSRVCSKTNKQNITKSQAGMAARGADSTLIGRVDPCSLLMCSMLGTSSVKCGYYPCALFEARPYPRPRMACSLMVSIPSLYLGIIHGKQGHTFIIIILLLLLLHYNHTK